MPFAPCRLSEMADARVLAVEAGPKDTDPFIHLPVGFFKMTSGPLIWGWETAPLRHANNRTAVYPQARVLGGGSSINAEIFTRGCPEDYDAWANEFGWADLQIAIFQFCNGGTQSLQARDHQL